MVGINLNPGAIGLTVCDFQSNLKASWQFRVNLKDKTTPQTKVILGDSGKESVKVAASHGVPIDRREAWFHPEETQH